MKRLIFYICFLVSAVLSANAESLQANGQIASSSKVLIINSYRVETVWSNSLVVGLEEKLLHMYPGIQTITGALNVDVAVVRSTPEFNLRSIMWSFSAENSEHISPENSSDNTLFLSEVHPDVIVFVGDDALLFYQSFGLLLNQWRDVPIVLCGASESIVKGNWSSDLKFTMDSLIPIEERRTNVSFVPKSEAKAVDPGIELKASTKDGVEGYFADINYELTGVKAKLPIRENLELIKQLVPGLEEIIWVDNDYYGSVYVRSMVQNEMKAILPSVSLTSMTYNMMNADSIFDVILRPQSNKAYLTYSLNIDDVYSHQSNEQLLSLFRNYSTVPMFSLTERFSANPYDPYWMGGYFRPYSEYIDKTVNIVGRILKGEPANSIPFETVTGSDLLLNKGLLQRYGLLDKTRSLKDVHYENVPPTFYQKKEKRILAGIIIVAVLIGLFVYWLNGVRFNWRVQGEYIRYRRMYNKLQLIYGHTSIEFALYSKDGVCVLRIVEGKEDTTGKLKSDLFYDNLFENPDISKELKEQIRNMEAINAEIILNSAGRLSSVDSERKIYQLIVKPINDDNFQSAQYIAIAIDLNQIVRERQERERFESIFRFASDSSQMGLAFYNVDTGIGSGTNYWYYNLNEPLAATQMPNYLNVVEEDRDLLLDFRKNAQAGNIEEPFYKDIRVIGDDKEEHWITEHIFIDESDNKMLIEFNLNIDEQKKSEDKLLKAKEKAEQSIVETEEFLNSINHEIRTPLNGIVGFSAILAASEDDDERKDHVSIILKNNQLLTMLIDDVIQLSRIDSGQTTFTVEPVHVAELFEKVMQVGYSDLYDKNLTIIKEIEGEDPIVNTDSVSLYRLMTNLVSNGIKFTEEGSVTLGYRKEPRRYYFYVKDTGCGISEVDIKRIFKRFDKLNSYMQGTGLGLSLCKTIIQRLNGEIGVESELGKGSTFWFSLPVSR